MKKYLFILLSSFVMLMLFNQTASAQLRLGVKGGVNTIEDYTGFHGGVALQVGVPFIGLKIQPELLYSTKGSTLILEDGITKDFRSGYLEIPVHLQLGLDLILLRPYLAVSPYAGFSLHDNFNQNDKKVHYGIGVGGGLDIWRMQVQLLYQWDLTPYHHQNYYRGLQISAAFFF